MEITRYKSFFVLSLLLVGMWSAVWAAPEIETISSTDRAFHFTCRFNDFPTSVEGDSAVLPGYTVQVAVPPQAEARLVSAQGDDVKPVDGATLGERPLVEVGQPAWFRGRKLVGVRISPLIDGGCYSEVEIELAFDQKASRVQLAQSYDPRSDKILRSVIANYEVARLWPVRERTPRSAATSESNTASNLNDADQWYQIKTDQTGFYRVTGAQLSAAGVALAGLSSDSIRVFNAGGLVLPVDNSLPRPTLEEMSILVLDGGDGQFGSSDQVYFFAEAADRWTYEADEAPIWVNNPYTNNNVYWLAVSGSFSDPAQRMGEIDGAPSGSAAFVANEFENAIHLEQDNMISLESDGHYWDYYNWYWTSDESFTTYVTTPGISDGDSAAVYISAKNDRDVDLRINNVSATRIGCTSSQCRFYTRALEGAIGWLNSFAFTLPQISDGIPAYFDYLEIRYRSTLLPTSNRLDCYLTGLDGLAEVQAVDNFTTVPTILDISDPQHPSTIVGFERSGGQVRFDAGLATSRVNRYYFEPLSAARTPLSIARVDFTDPRSNPDRADLIVITTRALRSALADYIDYRESQGYAVMTVAVEDIMQSFGYGMYDPTAIRDFLKYAYEHFSEPSPSAVLLVGDANYDMLNHLGTGVPNYVPSFIRPTDRSYSDDNYVYFGDFGILDGEGGDRQYDMMIARWSVRTTAEIQTIFSKIKDYESTSDFDPWRARVTLVADDEHTNTRDNETFHVTQTEELETEHLPRVYNRNKIYLWDYPFVNGEKPAVNDAIVGAFNDGSLIVNYVGHGNPDVWAHEHVFQRGADLGRLHNIDRLALVYAASCDIGFFDDPQREGMAEDLLVSSQGGAIAVISATRLVYSADNAVFNRVVYDKIFGDESLSVGEALFAAKLQRQYSSLSDSIPSRVDNDRAYTLFGDPYLVLGRPHLDVEFTESPDSLEALGISHLAGRVVDGSGALYPHDGRLLVTVFDSDREKVYRIESDDTPYEYNMAGPSIYRGSASITNGAFELDFVTPLDVTYRGTSARVSAYAIFPDLDGLGFVDSLPVGDEVAEISDSVGPQIVYGIVGRESFVSGDAIALGNSLSLELTDPSGVNLVGGIGHGISLVVDRQTDKSITLSDRFEYDQDDYTNGRLAYPLTDLAVGQHHLKIKAWDNANNAATAEFEVEIVAAGNLAIHDLLNFPNPMGDATTFYFELTQPVNQFTLEIFTLSGKNIWSRRCYGLGADYYPNSSSSIVWDGRDLDGDRVGTGVYLYKATAVPRSGGETVEEFGKIVVVN